MGAQDGASGTGVPVLATAPVLATSVVEVLGGRAVVSAGVIVGAALVATVGVVVVAASVDGGGAVPRWQYVVRSNRRQTTSERHVGSR